MQIDLKILKKRAEERDQMRMAAIGAKKREHEECEQQQP